MPNELVARNGLIALNNSIVTGSLNVTNGITGSLFGTSSWTTQALTASSADAFNVRGTLTATTLVVQTITSSTDFVTGSTRFGSLLSNTHVFSGSVTMNPGGLFVSSSGLVGIGTTSPQTRLAVGNGSLADTNVPLQISSQGNATQAFIGINKNGGYGLLLGYNETTGSLSGIGAYIRQVSTDPLHFAVNNTTTAMTILSSGNVGIGTTAPKTKLDVAGAGGKISITNTGTSDYGELQYYEGSTLKADIWVNGSAQTNWAGANSFNIYQASNAPMAFYTNAANERMRIEGGGNVGIGSTSPSQKLDVVGIIKASGASNSLMFDNRSAAGNTWEWYSQGSVGSSFAGLYKSYNTAGTVLAVKDDGNVGIGTTSPAYLLDVAGTSRSDLHIFRSNQSAPTTDAFIFRPADNTVALGTANTERLRINSSGNVGIGTTSPSRKLHVVGSEWDNTSGGGIIFENSNTVGASLTLKPSASTVTNGTSGWAVYAGGPGAAIGDGNMGFWAHGTNEARFVIQRGGNVGIGNTSPSYKLEVSGELGVSYTNAIATMQGGTGYSIFRSYAGNGSSTSVVEFQIRNRADSADFATMGTYSNHDVRIRTNNTDKVTIQAGGNVGIGTTSPGVKLDVVGSGKFTNDSSNELIYAVSANTGGTVLRLQNTSTGGDSWRFYSTGVGNGEGAGHLLFNNVAGVKMIIKSDGNVGIGTTSPSSRLSIQNNGASDNVIMNFLMTNGSNAATFRTTDSGVIFGIHSQNSGDIYIKDTSDNVLFYGKNGGNVGIGTTTPLTKLHVNGSISAEYSDSIYLDYSPSVGSYKKGFSGLNQSTNSARGLHIFNYDADSSQGINFWVGTNASRVQAAIITNSGNVGIGTTSPTQKLDVVGAGLFGSHGAGTYSLAISNNDQSNVRFRITNTGTGGQSFSIVGGIPGVSNSGLSIYDETNTATRLYVSASGFVGIGTTAPINLLHLQNGNATYSTPESTNVPNLYIYNSNSSSTSAHSIVTLRTNNTGGGNPFISFDVNQVTGYSMGVDNADSDKFKLANNWSSLSSSTLLTVTTGGNVGIGTTAPSRKLDVNGTSVFRDFTSVFAGAGNVVSNITWLSTDSGIMNIYTGGTATVQLNSSGVSYFNGGSVGIGTTSPFSLLTVLGAGGTTNGITTGISSTQKEQFLMESRTVGTTAGNTTEVCSITCDNGAGLIEVNLIGHVSGDSVSAKYILPVQYGNDMGGQNGNWQLAFPISSLLTYGTGTIALDIRVNNNITTLRLRRTANSSVNPTYTLSIKVLGNTFSYTSSSTTATGVSAPTLVYGGAQMVLNGNGNVGIGTTSPASRLQIGSLSSVQTATPETLSLGGTYSNSAGSNVKFRVYEEAGAIGGMSVSSGQTEVNTWSSGNLAFYRGTTQTMIINTSGNVGIGLTSPPTRLAIVGGSTFQFGIDGNSGNNQIYLRGGTSGDKAQITLNHYGFADYAIAVGYAANGILSITKTSGGSDGIIINSSGNVGIGTTSPSGPLHVVTGGTSTWAPFIVTSTTLWGDGSTPYVTIGAGGAAGIMISNPHIVWSSGNSAAALRMGRSGGISSGAWYEIGTGANDNFFIAKNGLSNGYQLYINSGGNVGIGTTSPTSDLHVYDNSDVWHFRAGGASGELRIGGQTSSGAVIQAYTPGGTVRDLYLQRDGGSIGIGTTAPAVRLNVRGDEGQPGTSGTTQNGILRVHAGSTEGWGETLDMGMHVGISGPASYAWLQATNTGNLGINYSLALNPNGGNVGIGTTSPSAHLHVYSAGGPSLWLTAGGSGTGGLRIIKGDSGTAYINNQDSVGMQFQIAGSTKMTIDSGGNIGIGTTSPGYKLDVSGTYRLGPTNGVYFQNYTYGPEMNLSGLSSGGWARASRITTADTSNTVFFGVLGNNTSLTRAYWNIGNPSDETGYTYSTGISLLPGGNVGIGTTSPSYMLHVNGGAIVNQTNINSTGDPGLLITSGHRLGFDQSGTRSWNVKATGGNLNFTSGDGFGAFVFAGSNSNIGIGTTSPLSRLDVYSSTATATAPTVFLSQNAGYGQIAALDPYHGIILRGYPTVYNDYTTSAADVMSFYEYGGDFRFYIKNASSTLTMQGRLYSGTWTVTGDVVAYGSPSDITLKTNIKPLEGALEKVTKLQGVSFTWKEDTDANKMTGIKDDIGFIAQEVQEVLPDLVRKNDNGLLSLRDKGITALLVEAIKEQQQQIDELKYLLQNK